jgi:hypothetical protein
LARALELEVDVLTSDLGELRKVLARHPTVAVIAV